MNFIAHRCNDIHNYQENSIDACLDVLSRDYIGGIEIDVRLTKDDILIVIHDKYVRLVNNKIINVNKYKYKKFKNCLKNKDISIVSLDYFLSKINSNKKIIIEIKDDNEKIVHILNRTISKYNLNFYICSFNYDLMVLFKKNYSRYKSGLIIGYMLNYDKIHNNFDFNLLHYNLINRVNLTKENFIWTVNNKKIYDKIINKNKNIYIISDKSYLLK